MKYLAALAGPASLAFLLSACAEGVASPQSGLSKEAACFLNASESVPVTLEVAETLEQRSKGLMGRTGLDDNAGMLFVYEEDRAPEHGFWMYKTLIPLDIAYVSAAGRIENIRNMVPCASADTGQCPTYPAGVTFRYAVEMAAGYFQEHSIGVGDYLRIGNANCPS